MAVCLLPGTVAAANVTTIVVAPASSTVVQGTTVDFSAQFTSTDVTINGLYWGDPTLTTSDYPAVNTNIVWTVTDPLAVMGTPLTVGSTEYQPITFNSVGTWTVYATDSTDLFIPGSATVVVTSAGVQSFSIKTSGELAIPPVPFPADETVGVADTVKVCALDINGNTLTSYTGTVRFSSSDRLAALPANYTFVAADAGCHTFSVTWGTTDFQSIVVNDTSMLAMYGWDGVIVSLPESYSYYPLSTPVRVLDTRIGLGLAGKLAANVSQSFAVAGNLGVPWCAAAVTGNVTEVNATSGWAVYLGPNPTNTPTTSAINFNAGQVVGNNLTVAVNPTTGYVSATYISTAGNTTDLVFDVTGFYGYDAECTGWLGTYYHPMDTAVRVLDTRNNTGYAGKLSAGLPATWAVAGHSAGFDIPSCATAVTGNLAVVNPTSGWAVYLGPVATPIPTTSSVNFVAGETVDNGVTINLHDGSMSATYISTPGNTTDLVFDVTGYFCYPTEGTLRGALSYVPMAPVRLLDTRINLGAGSPAYANSPLPFQVSQRDWIPEEADAVTGNLTVVNETAGWAVYLGAIPAAQPTTSNINFLPPEVLGNGTTIGLHSSYPHAAGEKGMLNATYMSNPGNTTDLVFDVNGYFVHQEAGPMI
jgi:hypothetical protein